MKIQHITKSELTDSLKGLRRPGQKLTITVDPEKFWRATVKGFTPTFTIKKGMR